MSFGVSLIALAWAVVLNAQPPELPPVPLTIEQAIQFGIDHFPTVRASLARVSAEKAGVDLTRTAFLPRINMGVQGNMGTFNKASGLFFMTPYTPPIWGAPSADD